jgi:6-pyruvoyl-tetrahydropterin synthase
MAGVRLLGSRKISSDGYVIDFGDIKKVTRAVCKQLNEHFLCPTLSDVLDIQVSNDDDDGGKKPSTVTITCQDGSVFVFPKSDCAMLPIVHATAEELAIYLWSRILEGLNADYLIQRGIHTMEVTIAEAVGQQAVFRHEIPTNLLSVGGGDDATIKSGCTKTSTTKLDIPSFIMRGEIKPLPCPSAPAMTQEDESFFPTQNQPSQQQQQHDGHHHTTGAGGGASSCDTCLSQSSFFHKLEILATALNDKGVTYKENGGGRITAKDLEKLIDENNSNSNF